MSKNTKIDKLTPEQEALIPVYVERYIEQGLSAKPVSLERATEIVRGVYEKILEKPTPKVELVDGPISAWERVCDHCQLEEDERKQFIWPYLDGQFSAGYFAWVNYMREVLKVDGITDKYDAYAATIECGPIYTLDDLCVVVQTPEFVKRNTNGTHCDGGPAIRYRDGKTIIWALNGVMVPQWLAETPAEQIDASEFAKITNVEIRREFVRKVGMERIISDLECKVLDVVGDYELLSVPLGGTTGDWPYLKMKNPSIGVWHLEAVAKNITTVKEALSWRNQSDLEPEVLT